MSREMLEGGAEVGERENISMKSLLSPNLKAGTHEVVQVPSDLYLFDVMSGKEAARLKTENQYNDKE